MRQSAQQVINISNLRQHDKRDEMCISRKRNMDFGYILIKLSSGFGN